MIELRTPAEIEQMKAAGSFVGRVLEATRDAAAVGVNLLELDALAHDMIRAEGAESCYIDYHPSFGGSPFGKVICTSVNDAVLHGLPHNYKLQDGDLLTLDFAAIVDGWAADSALSVVVGTPRDEDLKLIATTEKALEAGIAAVFDAIRSTEADSPEGEDESADESSAEDDDTAPEDSGVTFALLTELNRLWERPPV